MKKPVSTILLVVFANMSCAQDDDWETNGGYVGTIVKDAPYDIEMVELPSGTVKIDATYANMHSMVVSIERFYIGKYEVTQRQWQALIGDNPSEVKGADYPVTNVNWYEAVEFVKRLSEETGHTYRLPTEFEWEYACRAGTTTDYLFGNDTSLIGEYEWWNGNSGANPHPVGLKRPNRWHLYDMNGNVNELTATYFDPQKFYREHPDDGREFVDYRIVRGSSFVHGRAAHFRSDYQHAYSAESRRNYLGFRLAREK
jgi:formylglycine-generating enzyme required for sulfatase activity